MLLQGGTPGHQGSSHSLWVPSTRAGPGHITKAPEAASAHSSGLLCPGPHPGGLWPLVPAPTSSLLRSPGSALTQFFVLGPGSLSKKSLLFLLLPPAGTGALSPWGSAGPQGFMVLLLVFLGMFPGQAI